MTNEELAVRIHNGETELTMLLWERVKGLTVSKATNFYFRFQGRAEMDDFRQAGFEALLKTIKVFTAETQCSFILAFQQNLMYEFQKLVGQRGRRYKQGGQYAEGFFDPLFDAKALDEPADDTQSHPFADVIPDENSEAVFDGILDNIVLRQDSSVVKRCMQKRLSPQKQTILNLHFWRGLTAKEAGEKIGLSEKEAKCRLYDSLAVLRRCPEIQSLRGNYVNSHTNFLKRKGAAAYQSSGTSTVEDLVEQRERYVQKYLSVHPRSALSQAQLVEAIQLRQEGQTLKQVSDRYSISLGGLSRMLTGIARLA